MQQVFNHEGTKKMRILVYKQTHLGDPNPKNGVWGRDNCMGRVRAFHYDAVIAVGGSTAQQWGCDISGKVTWIGVGPHKWGQSPDCRGPLVSFKKKFRHFGDTGASLADVAPNLSKRVRSMKQGSVISLSAAEQCEAESIIADYLLTPSGGGNDWLKRSGRCEKNFVPSCLRG